MSSLRAPDSPRLGRRRASTGSGSAKNGQSAMECDTRIRRGTRGVPAGSTCKAPRRPYNPRGPGHGPRRPRRSLPGSQPQRRPPRCPQSGRQTRSPRQSRARHRSCTCADPAERHAAPWLANGWRFMPRPPAPRATRTKCASRSVITETETPKSWRFRGFWFWRHGFRAADAGRQISPARRRVVQTRGRAREKAVALAYVQSRMV